MKAEIKTEFVGKNNDTLHSKIPYLNGKIEGVGYFFHNNGSVLCETHFKNNEADGIKKWWTHEGIQTCEEFHIKSQPFGLIKMWNEDGRIRKFHSVKGSGTTHGSCLEIDYFP